MDLWLDAIKPGYGARFVSAFEKLGVEDIADVANIDLRFFADLQAALLECGAKPMHIKNIRLALLDTGCNLEEPASGAATSIGGAASAPRKALHQRQKEQQHRQRPAARASVASAEAAALAAAGRRSKSPVRRTDDAGEPRTSNGSVSGAFSLDEEELVPVRVVPLSAASSVISNPGGVAIFGASSPLKPLPVHYDSAPPLPPGCSSSDVPPAADASRPPQKPPLPRSDSGFARSMQFEEYTLAVEAAQAAAAAASAAGSSGGGLWHKLAKGIETEAELHNFFSRRQSNNSKGGRLLHIQSAVKVVNNACLHAFASAQRSDINALKASKSKSDSYLFHGCAQASATNIQADGLRMGFAANGMLGRGLYGAPDPRKSLQYCKNSENGKFMFVCRFNLSAAKRAGPDTNHRNSIFDEFCVYDERHVVVLWMLKLGG